MAHLVVPQTQLPDLPIFFNVDGIVGPPPARNNREDVFLVQFAFKVISDSPKAVSPMMLAAAKAVRPTGTIDPATISAIRIIQEQLRKANPGMVVDGLVSPVKHNAYFYKGDIAWTIVHLNNAMQDRTLETWPRLDKIPGCPAELTQMVQRVVV